MKTFLITVAFITLFTACSTNNAFSEFNISLAQEINEENRQSSKMNQGNMTDGTIDVTYLNNTYPKEYEGYSFFYVVLYTKSSNQNVKFYINNNRALYVESLKPNNRFSNPNYVDNDWKKYYLVGSFESDESNVTFKVNNLGFTSQKMSFEKSE